ncbi:hypothetical protein Y1Q_0010277 [Alligator mississippiensis]|uniref:Fibrous sheath-interacting protein 2 C-terminal domain-containing protein n=1 Tax=Alligator mississippiensis TaxID=8496 RepID=A0A151P1I4_ALLMI|nr:hypothetical protein Y1Q_0010277 [Alligator mississippiensis]
MGSGQVPEPQVRHSDLNRPSWWKVSLAEADTDLDAENTLLLDYATRKILNHLHVLLSKHQMNMNEYISEREFLHTEDSQVMGDLFHSASTSIIEHSESHIFACRDLINRKDILVHRIAALIAKEVSKPEFQASSEKETLPTSSSPTEVVRIVEKLPTNLGMIKKIQKPTLNLRIPVVPMTFVEKILSRFLSKLMAEAQSTGDVYQELK